MTKQRHHYRALKYALIFVLVMYVFYFAFKYFHIALVKQPTPSMPEGYYLTYPAFALKNGDNVLFYPDAKTEALIVKRHWLPEHVTLLKKIVGVPGDHLCIKDQKVYINGRLQALVWKHDEKGHPLPVFRYCGKIKQGDYFVEGVADPRSFDSRYYGLVSRQQIISKAVKI